MKWLGVILLGVMMSACAGFVESQIFFPEKEYYASPKQFGLVFEDVWLTTSDGTTLHGWYLPAPGSRHLILFCHGNAGNISHRLDNLARLNQAGLAVFIFDYRGYGQSQGSPSEKGMYLDAEAAYDWAAQKAAEQGGKVVIFGRSLGGVAAVYLATERRPAGLILESTFTNLGDMAGTLIPIPGMKKWLGGRFNSLGRAPRVSAPVLMLHGDVDNVVPIALGRELFQALPQPKAFVLLKGAGHNDTYLVAGPEYFQRLSKFVTTID